MGACVDSEEKKQTVPSSKVFPQAEQIQNQAITPQSEVVLQQQFQSQSQFCVSVDGNFSQRNETEKNIKENSRQIIEKSDPGNALQENFYIRINKAQNINGNLRQTNVEGMRVRGKDRICGLTVIRQQSNADDDFSKASKLSMIDHSFMGNRVVVENKLRGTQVIRQSEQQDQNITKTMR